MATIFKQNTTSLQRGLNNLENAVGPLTQKEKHENFAPVHKVCLRFQFLNCDFTSQYQTVVGICHWPQLQLK